MFGLTKYGKFHKNDNKIGVELEVGLVDDNFKKPTSDYKTSIKANLEFTIEQSQTAKAALKGIDKKRYKTFDSMEKICNTYLTLLEDPNYEIQTSIYSTVKGLLTKDIDAIMKLGIKYCIDDFDDVVKSHFADYQENDREDRGLYEILSLIEVIHGIKEDNQKSIEYKNKAQVQDAISEILDNDQFFIDDPKQLDTLMKKFDVTKDGDGLIISPKGQGKKGALSDLLKDKFGPIVETQIGLTVGGAYSMKLLPTYQSMAAELTETQKEHIFYDPSDAIEVVSSPCSSIEELRDEMNSYFSTLSKLASDEDLNIVFTARLPDAKTWGWQEKLDKGDPQNMLGMHVHFGRMKNEFEGAFVYETLRRVSPEILALTANSGISDSQNVEAVCERQNIYKNIIPSEIKVNSNMGIFEKRRLRVRMKEIFGTNSKFEDAGMDSLSESLTDLLEANDPNPKKKKKKKKAKTTDKGSRGNSCVYLRPELGTVEVRIIDGQSDYQNNTLESHLNKNLLAVELVDAIGKFALDSYSGKQELIIRDNLDARYDDAIQYGLENDELNKSSSELLGLITPYLSEEAQKVFGTRIKNSESPAIEQKRIFEKEGTLGLYKRITVRS